MSITFEIANDSHLLYYDTFAILSDIDAVYYNCITILGTHTYTLVYNRRRGQRHSVETRTRNNLHVDSSVFHSALHVRTITVQPLLPQLPHTIYNQTYEATAEQQTFSRGRTSDGPRFTRPRLARTRR